MSRERNARRATLLLAALVVVARPAAVTADPVEAVNAVRVGAAPTIAPIFMRGAFAETGTAFAVNAASDRGTGCSCSPRP